MNRLRAILSSTVFLSFLSSLMVVPGAWANSFGITGYSGNPATNDGNICSACHTAEGVEPSVELFGETSIPAGTSHSYTLRMSGGQENSGGFNVSASSGFLSSTQNGVAVQNGELHHTQKFTVDATGTIEWKFTFKAPPTPGEVTLYAAALSANGDGTTGGDFAKAAVPLVIEVTGAAVKLPPVAHINGPSFAQPNESLDFNSSDSIPVDGEIIRYLWDFGDGSGIHEGEFQTHSFATQGEYTVTMAATAETEDGLLLTGTVAATVMVSTDSGNAQGAALYNEKCFACHGQDGAGGIAIAINTGYTAEDYLAAISDSGIPQMQGISLTPEEAQLIEDYLASGGGGEPPVRPTDGVGLYGQFCSACHGADGRGGNNIGVTGAPFAMIDEAIQNVPAMQGIDLSLEEIQKVADFLVAGGSGDLPTDGTGLYAVFCSVCHGAGGHGGKYKVVTGASTPMVSDAIANIALMQPLSLDAAQIQSVAEYLSAGGDPPLPTDGKGLYDTFCGVCHGAGGHGGKFLAVTGASQQMISAAIADEEWMQMLVLDNVQRQSIAGYLAAGGEPPLPADGKGLYDTFCGVCHGAGGQGGKFKAVTGAPAQMINDGIANQPWMQSLQLSGAQVDTIAGYLLAGGEPQPTDSAGIYHVYCSVCHGPNGGGGKYRAITGAAEEMINEAIMNVALMSDLPLTQDQSQQVSDYLVSGAGQTIPEDGAGLYGMFCAVCHGEGGQNGKFLAVTGASNEMIDAAIVSEPWMDTLPLTPVQTQSIADYLGAGGQGPLPVSGSGLYTTFCAVCHGAGGHGGKFFAVTGAANEMISAAIENEPWMDSLQLTLTQVQQISDYLGAGGEPPLPEDGAGLYQTFCSVCHGEGGTGGKYLFAVTGASDEMITEAIATEQWMNSLQLTQAQIQLIAGYLGAGGGATLPVDGAGLYSTFCSICHGSGGHGGKFFAVTGAPEPMISGAIANEPWMDSLTLTQSQLNQIADYLVAGGSGPVPTQGDGLYGVYCSVCHGGDGRGGIYKVVTGASASFINRALNNRSLMQPLDLNSTQVSAITDFLAAGGGGTKPTDGAGLYHVYCETCHGPNGSGGPEENIRGESASQISGAINEVSNMRQLQPYLSSSDISLISNFLSQ